ncbi:MAG: ATP-binding protein [Tepidisphaeraceae bacterium]
MRRRADRRRGDAAEPTRHHDRRRRDDPPWVERIFLWFTRDKLGYRPIAQRLKKEGAPISLRANRWNARVVRALLANRRYLGDWSYGRMQSVWQSKADYSRRIARQAPLREYQNERLRIIDNAIFDAAQARIESMKLGGHGSFSYSGAELLFQVFADRYERGSILITSNLPFGEWGQIFQGDRMTAALLDRLTHRCTIFEMNGESYRFRESTKRTARANKERGRPRRSSLPDVSERTSCRTAQRG